MIWGEETPGRTDQFEAEILPEARYLDMESTGLVGVGRAEPQVDPRAEGSGLSATDASLGNSAWRRRLSPRHRRAVGAYFGTGNQDD